MSSAEGTSAEVFRESNLPGVELIRRGKGRDLYDLGDRYLIIATDRISAFDVVLPQGIPDKGRVLTQLSLFWFDLLGVEHHLISSDVADLPESCEPFAEQLRYWGSAPRRAGDRDGGGQAHEQQQQPHRRGCHV